MKTYKFYDTSSLLLRTEDLFQKEDDDEIIISSITLSELEHIKTSVNKTPEARFAARKLSILLDSNPDKYYVHIFRENMMEAIRKKQLPENHDTQILAAAIDYDKNIHPDETVFVTNDLALKNIANLFFGNDSILSVVPIEEEYLGYKDVTMDDDEMTALYSDFKTNRYNLYVNEYLLVRNKDGEVVDKLVWTANGYRNIEYANLQSIHFGNIKPITGDPYQALLGDSFKNNTITLARGSSGTGKSLLSLAFLFSALEHHKIDKIIIFCNTIATKDSAKLGYYPGTRDEKLLDSQIGNLLSSKLGSRMEVERLISEEKLLLLPLSDIRGYDTTGMKAGIYISEAQNLSISMIKLALQRIGSDCICIIDGDDKTQVDMDSYSGANNGMKRVSKIFKGQDFYGEVTLQNIHRSKIAQIAELL